ncbi:hypothetical protein FJ950_17865 [Mesorhizobium sp. B2-3-14]|uniref:hypothetical protein n=1 Tax=Mesorhizobium sp. B2-3-14 TaxID=2589950 RepID=UPI00112BD645|nr:hypothetical protein [Mesorhizobium sp. B2-3-14]TPL84061.1 hypothetical protein FJ950_17865 [Mesorhizobium sp. B2-3-14]
MTETIVVEYTGSYRATHRDSGNTIDTSDSAYGRRTYKDPLGPLCRVIRDEVGFSPDTLIHVERDGVPVFKRDHSLAYWADHDVVDEQTKVAKRIKYRAFDVPAVSDHPIPLEALKGHHNHPNRGILDAGVTA